MLFLFIFTVIKSQCVYVWNFYIIVLLFQPWCACGGVKTNVFSRLLHVLFLFFLLFLLFLLRTAASSFRSCVRPRSLLSQDETHFRSVVSLRIDFRGCNTTTKENAYGEPRLVSLTQREHHPFPPTQHQLAGFIRPAHELLCPHSPSSKYVLKISNDFSGRVF